jgi:hypothetical protein
MRFDPNTNGYIMSDGSYLSKESILEDELQKEKRWGEFFAAKRKSERQGKVVKTIGAALQLLLLAIFLLCLYYL